MDANSDTHEHVLWALNNLLVNLEEVGPLEGLESEVIVVEVASLVNGLVERVGIVFDDLWIRQHKGKLSGKKNGGENITRSQTLLLGRI